MSPDTARPVAGDDGPGVVAVEDADSTSVPLDLTTARELTDSIKIAAATTWVLIAEAYRRRAWVPLGYTSWDTYCSAEFSGMQIRMPRTDREQVVVELRQAGLSTRAIASATGCDRKTISSDLNRATSEVGEFPPPDAPITGTDGKQYPPKTSTPNADEEAGQDVEDVALDVAHRLLRVIEPMLPVLAKYAIGDNPVTSILHDVLLQTEDALRDLDDLADAGVELVDA